VVSGEAISKRHNAKGNTKKKVKVEVEEAVPFSSSLFAHMHQFASHMRLTFI